MNGISISNASKDHSTIIAWLIMTAMSDECCRYFYGDGHTKDDFHHFMTSLVERTDSQYSYKNTLIATDDDIVIGAAVSYDGGQLHTLRRAFVEGMMHTFHRNFDNIDDETQAGELYLDSFAVLPQYRNRGIGTMLLQATIDKARMLKIPSVGLLVDVGNPDAEQLYLKAGFTFSDDNSWGGHAMKHLVYKL
jgi:ribosomal protein S18 acetylase RimI-like enzyme